MIVETARGVEYGKVVIGTRKVKDQEVIQPLKSVIRIATEQDQKTEEKIEKKKRNISDLSGKDQKAWSGDETDRCGIYI